MHRVHRLILTVVMAAAAVPIAVTVARAQVAT